MFSSSKNSLPRRTDSLTVAASSAPKFTEIEEELHDIRRVHTHGQEEDLRMALSRMISRVEELSSLLKEAYRAQTDLQTELVLAKSNLQLALANNEMLEDALNRDVPGSSKDVGWRRFGAKEHRERELEGLSRRSIDSSHSIDVSTPSPGQSPIPGTTTPAEGRFFKFRFGTGPASATSSGFPSPRLPGSPRLGPAHLTSASLPSLVPEREKEFEALTAELEKEKKAHAAASAAKEALEAELESLSQALFEEANKMVATERMKLADTEEELREAHAEKEALRSALKLLEQERQASISRKPNATSRPSSPSSSAPSHPSHPMHGRSMSTVSVFSSSSAIAIKSPPSSSASAPSSPVSARRLLPDDFPLSASTVVPTPVSTAVRQSDDDLPSQDSTPQPVIAKDAPATEPSAGPVSKENNASSDKERSTTPPSETVTTPADSSPSPPAITYPVARSMMFFDGDGESPWADVRSATASPAGML